MEYEPPRTYGLPDLRIVELKLRLMLPDLEEELKRLEETRKVSDRTMWLRFDT